MVTIMQDLPSHVVGVTASGKVTKEDFSEVVLPAVEALVKRTDKINYLLLLQTEIGNIEAGAWLQDAYMGLKNLMKWNRAAIVTDQKAVEKFTDAFCYVVPGEFRGFSIAQLEEAKAWVSAG